MPKSVLTVTRHPGKKNPFHRAVRNRKGNVEKLLRFEPDQAVSLSQSEADLVTKDIGRALVIIEPDETRPGRFIVDWETTRKVFAEVHNTELEVSPRARRAIGTSDTPPANVIDVRRKPAKATADNQGGDGAAGQGDETAIELPDELIDLLERHGETLPSPLSVDGLTQWIKDGGELMLLDGFSIDSAAAVHQALGLDAPVVENADDSAADVVADQAKLIEAGLSQELVDALAKNLGEHPWVTDPEQIKAKVGEGFDLTKLSDIANGRSKQIRTALGIVEQK